MANYPDVIETFTNEINDDGSDTVGTIIDATDQNRVYALLGALQTWVGPNTDPDTGTSHEARLKAIESVTLLTNPMTTAGAMIVSADTSGTPAALLLGTPGQVLTVVGGMPAWAAAAASGFPDPMANAGDLIVRNVANVTARLGVGTAGQFLGVAAGQPAWQTPNYVPAPGSPAQGDVLSYDGTTWVRIAPGVAGQVLKTGGPAANVAWGDVSVSPPGSAIAAPSGSVLGNLLRFDGTNWVNLVPGSAGLFLKSNGPGVAVDWALPAGGFANPMTTLSDLIIGLTGGAPGRLGIGTTGYVLTVVAGAPAWAANPAGFADPLTTRGDLIVRGASATTRLGLGANGTVLTSNGTDATWAAAAAAAAPDYLTALWFGGN